MGVGVDERGQQRGDRENKGERPSENHLPCSWFYLELTFFILPKAGEISTRKSEELISLGTH